MREFKFRAWDSERKEMIYPGKNDNYDKDLWDGAYGSVIGMLNGMFKYHFHYRIMQYIGLKDKNEKEIYEGDIVGVPSGSGGDVFYNMCSAIVEYDAPDFYLKGINTPHELVFQEFSWDDLSIEGNIYEH